MKNGIQQIRAHITFHTNGQLILWPYGHTKTDIPPDMSIDDHTAFVTMGKAMARLNGYKAEQSSDLYITDGDQIDWLYGRHRIFSYTWELYPPETSTVWGDHYPPDEQIAPQTARNRGALLYFLDIAGCPYRAIGKERTDCGPFRDDFEINRGWQFNPYGTDTAVRGTWVAARRPSRPRSAAPGSSSARRTPASSRWSPAARPTAAPAPTISTAAPRRSGPRRSRCRRRSGRSRSATTSPTARTARRPIRSRSTSMPGGVKTRVFREYGTAFADGARWVKAGTPLSKWAGQTVRLVFVATDGGPDSTVEARPRRRPKIEQP